MRKVTFGESVLKIEGLETKFDVVPVSNSLAILVGDRDEATIVQQLYHWTNKDYGQVIEGVRWFYKSIDEWIREVFPTFSPWKLGKMMRQLCDRGIIRREKLFTKHQIQKCDHFWWQPKNQTYYYSLNFDKLQELADNYGMAETPVNSVSIKTQTLSIEEIKNTKDFDCAKNNTDITSIENSSKDQSHPYLPCASKAKEIHSQEKQELSNPELPKIQEFNSANSKEVKKDINSGRVDENINKNNCTGHDHVQVKTTPKPKIPKGTKSATKRMNSSPWKDEEQFKRFYRALIQALPIVANARSPQGLAQVIIRQLKSGVPHSYWDDFVAGLPIGTSTKPEWEVEPGVPYPMFIEYLTEKIIKGNNTQTAEQARNEVFRILSQPRQATAFWGQFKRSVVNISQQVERDRDLGVSNPSTPIWTRERVEPSISEAIAAGQKITAANGSTPGEISAARTNLQLEAKSENNSSTIPPISDPWTDSDSPLTLREMAAKRKIKGFGFVKAMPQASQSEVKADARQSTKSKTNISQMSMAEINEYLTDPVLRAQLAPQLMKSDYELITDELGRIIGVKAPPLTVE